METKSNGHINKLQKIKVGIMKNTSIIVLCYKTVTLFQCLKMLGFTHIVLQTGSGEFQLSDSTVEGIQIDHFRYKPSIKADIEEADLVISHAGNFWPQALCSQNLCKFWDQRQIYRFF